MERQFLGVWIPKEIYLHKGLTPTEKLLLAEISSFSKNGICFASNEHFSEFLGVSKKHVSRLISKFVEMGFVTVELIYKNNTKEVEKRTITPIYIQEDTPPHLGGYPHHIQEDTPPLSCVDPLPIDAYYKEQDKNTIKEQDKVKKINKKEISAKKLEEEFEQLWKIYPRKLGKKKAFDSFKKARKIKKIPYETIENGLYRYIKYLEQQETEEQFIMHGSTWFASEKWQDEYITTGINRKPKNAMEYFRMKYDQGDDYHESNRNGEVINDYPELIPELF